MASQDVLRVDGRSKPRPERKNGEWFYCDHCGEPTYRAKAVADRLREQGSKVFCDRECHDAHHRARIVEKACENCGKTVVRRPSEAKDATYCSAECRDAHGRCEVECAWPGCTHTMPARMYQHKNGPVYKTELTKTGSYHRFPICAHHRQIGERYLGSDFRPNGKLKWMADPEVDLGSRTLTSKITRLVIFLKSDGCCAMCRSTLDFTLTGEWQIDHMIPVFRGGKTNYFNLQALCTGCHDKKTAIEKSEVGRRRGKISPLGRWKTHPQKDAEIMSLRAEVAALKAEITRLKESDYARTGVSRRVPVETGIV